MCVLKKLHNPMNDLTAFISVGGCAALIALNLSLLGLIPSGVITKPAYFSITEEAFFNVQLHVIFF
jgi:hypothetical protein